MCEQIEQKFFTGQNTFFFGDKATVVDYVFYQELLSAMILSGNGTQSEFLKAEPLDNKLPHITKWYNQISNDKACKTHADLFILEMT